MLKKYRKTAITLQKIEGGGNINEKKVSNCHRCSSWPNTHKHTLLIIDGTTACKTMAHKDKNYVAVQIVYAQILGISTSETY